MRQIKKERLWSVDCFPKAAQEFAHHNLFVKSWLKPNTACHPNEKNRERGKPRPPSGPGATHPGFRRVIRSNSTAQLEHRDTRKQKGVDNRTFNQHRHGKQNKDVELIA